jgi:hypothetical protein
LRQAVAYIGRKIDALNYPDCSFGGKATGLQQVEGSDDDCGVAAPLCIRSMVMSAVIVLHLKENLLLL